MATAETPEPPPHTYVALGDSFASGPGLAPFADPYCERSQRNYGHLVAEALELPAFVDGTCGGAVAENFWMSQKDGVAPQLDALTPDTDLVTVTIGGNDAGFVEVLATCGVLGLAPAVPDPCRTYYARTGSDELVRRMNEVVAPRIRAVFDGIRDRAPHATIVATTYLHILPDTGHCWPAIPFATGDLSWLAGVQRSLNSVISTEARNAGILVADMFAPSAEHDACRPADVRWTEPLTGTGPAPAHPNYAGMSKTAATVVSVLADHGMS
ncbi:SGNH/GDSL hydrolase family protein [Nocardia sp. NPDC050193]